MGNKGGPNSSGVLNLRTGEITDPASERPTEASTEPGQSQTEQETAHHDETNKEGPGPAEPMQLVATEPKPARNASTASTPEESEEIFYSDASINSEESFTDDHLYEGIRILNEEAGHERTFHQEP